MHPARRVSRSRDGRQQDGTASVYDPADAIAGAAKYLLAHGVVSDVAQAIFAYNHLQSYVQAVLYWAGFTPAAAIRSARSRRQRPACLPGVRQAPNDAAAAAVAYAEQQLGKPTSGAALAPTRSTARAWS